MKDTKIPGGHWLHWEGEAIGKLKAGNEGSKGTVVLFLFKEGCFAIHPNSKRWPRMRQYIYGIIPKQPSRRSMSEKH